MCPIDVTKSGIDQAEGRDYGLKFHPIDLSRNADCIVRIDQDEFHCHLLVLQSYSTFFDERNYKEIDLTGVSYRNFSFIPLLPLGIADTCALPVSREQKRSNACVFSFERFDLRSSLLHYTWIKDIDAKILSSKDIATRLSIYIYLSLIKQERKKERETLLLFDQLITRDNFFKPNSFHSLVEGILRATENDQTRFFPSFLPFIQRA